MQRYQSLDFHDFHYLWNNPLPIGSLARVCLLPGMWVSLLQLTVFSPLLRT